MLTRSGVASGRGRFIRPVAGFSLALLLGLASARAARAAEHPPEVLPEAFGTEAILPIPVLDFAAEAAPAYVEATGLPFENNVLLLAGGPAGGAEAAPVVVRQLVTTDAYADKWRRFHLVDGDLKSFCYTEMTGYERYPAGKQVPNSGRLDRRPYHFSFRLAAPARVNYLVAEGVQYPAPKGEVYAWSDAPQGEVTKTAGWARRPLQQFEKNTNEVLTLRLSPVETSRLLLRLTPTGPDGQKTCALSEVSLYEVAGAPRAEFKLGEPVTLDADGSLACADRTGLDGAELSFTAPAAVDGLFALSIADPGAPEYVAARLVFRVQAEAGQALGPLVFDCGDLVAEKGEKLAFRLERLSGTGALALTGCRLACKDPAAAAPEFAATLMKRARLEYSEGAEGWQWVNRTEGRPDIAAPTLPPVDISARLKGPPGAPDWAVSERALLQELSSMTHWWIDERMQSDAQMGGGWNDDCELTFRWVPLALMAGDQQVHQALRLYADAIWNSGRIDKKYGYCCVPNLYDVEHACEDTTCTQPFLVLLDYGDPEYVERNMLTISNFDFWTGGLNPQGHRHFRSTSFQAREFKPPVTDKQAYDHPYCAYALTPGLAAVWYNDQPLAKKWLLEYGVSWAEDIRADREGKKAAKGGGKAVPRNVGWLDCSTKGSKYYPGGSGNLMGCLKGIYLLTHDERLLEPFEKMPERNPDSKGLFADIMLAHAAGRDTPAYHALDQEILASAAGNDGDAKDYYRAWALSGDKAFLARGCQAKLTEAVANRFMNTEADPPTDRSYITGDELLAWMYLGGQGFIRESAPWLAVSWSGLGDNLAALVLEHDAQHLKVLVYSFAEQEAKVNAHVWELAHGKYDVRFGKAGDQDLLVEQLSETKDRELGRGDRVEFSLPPRTPCILELTQTAALDDLRARADLAATWRDVRYEPTNKRLVVRVHNIGIAPAKDLRVVVRLPGGKETAAEPVAELAAPLDLHASVVEVGVPYEPDGQTAQAVLDPENKIPEITEENNAVWFKIPIAK